ncbi:MAG: hypothetical protein R2800_00780 [Flavipsychrobacter sp.]
MGKVKNDKNLKSGFFKKLSTQYRIVFIDDNSLEEVASYRLTMRKLYILLSTLFVMVSFITIALILYTPLKYYVPGYASGSNRSQIIKLKHTVDSLSDRVSAQEQYEQSIRDVLSGNIVDRDTAKLDLKKYNEERKNSLLKTEEIKRTAIKEVAKENKKKK